MVILKSMGILVCRDRCDRIRMWNRHHARVFDFQFDWHWRVHAVHLSWAHALREVRHHALFHVIEDILLVWWKPFDIPCVARGFPCEGSKHSKMPDMNETSLISYWGMKLIKYGKQYKPFPNCLLVIAHQGKTYQILQLCNKIHVSNNLKSLGCTIWVIWLVLVTSLNLIFGSFTAPRKHRTKRRSIGMGYNLQVAVEFGSRVARTANSSVFFMSTVRTSSFF